MPARAMLRPMTIALRKPMSLQDFLSWEREQELRFEFDGQRPVAMTGGTAAHALLQGNLAAALIPRLRGQPCRFLGSDIKVQVAGSIRYPDGLVTCAPLPPRSTVVREPVVVFEVLSPRTASTDRITKNHEYASTPSIRRYVMLEQDRVGATVFSRQGTGQGTGEGTGEGADWVGHILLDDAVLDLPEIGISLPLRELYEGIEVAGEDSAEEI
ncbi:Uma2 family endonuclease [Roseomonas sp. GC11]|uniref:Uma2 family endonuclease n=1 Tax=Roseomonas sp. GC11 TaxID=2950546 RepID=UPI00210B6F2C|nr:Uma2 family endonuclease [Roseomonas sp. GC11]MCQ4159996.1 Uma2 family endonuclease [Roseomonas sp. GC11]